MSAKIRQAQREAERELVARDRKDSHSHPTTKAYRDNFDGIFRKRKAERG